MRAIGTRRRLPQRAAGLHGVPRLEGAALVLARLQRLSFLWAIVLVLLVPGLLAFVFGFFAFRSRITRRVLLDHHAGADLRADAAVLPQRDGLRRQQRLHRLQAHPRHPAHRRPPTQRRALRAHRRDAARRATSLCRYARHLASSAACSRAIRDAESTRDVLRLRPALATSSSSWTLSAVLCGHRRRALRAAGRHHQPERDVARPTRSRSRSGWRSAAAARWSAPVLGAGARERHEELVHRAPSPSTGSSSLGALFVLVTLLPARRAWSGSLAAAGAKRARRRARQRLCRCSGGELSRRAGRPRNTAAAGRRRRPGSPQPRARAGRARRLARRRSCTSRTSRVSFDGFKALNDLTLVHRRRASCAASSAPTAPARPR